MDLRVCTPLPILMPDKVRMARKWPQRGYSLNSLLVNPDVDYGAMGGLLALLRQGAFMAGPSLQDCFLCLFVSPSSRRFLGVRLPLSGRLGVYLFLPFLPGRSPVWNGRCAKEVSR